MLKNQLRDITNKKWEDFFRIFQADWPFLFYFETTKQAVVLFSFAHSDSGRPERSTSFVVNTNLVDIVNGKTAVSDNGVGETMSPILPK